jgi:hypothetical protein
MKCKIVLAVISFVIITHSICLGIGPGELPFGIMIGGSDQTAIGQSDSLLHALKDTLGFNLVYLCDLGGIDSTIRQAYHSHGLDDITYLTDPEDQSLDSAYQAYLTAHYMLTRASDQSSEIRFKYRNLVHGHDSSGTSWFVANAYSDSFTFLDEFWYNHLWKYLDVRIDYTPSLYMRLDTNSVVADTYKVVAYLNVWKADDNPWAELDVDKVMDTQNRHATLYHRDSIMVSDFDSAGNPVWVEKPNFYCNSCGNFDSDFLTYQIVSTGKFSFAIDTFKVSNENGRKIIHGDYDDRFANYCSAHRNDSTILYWQLKDDMRTDEMLPARHLDSLIDTSTTNLKSSMMKYYVGFIVSPTQFRNTANPKRFWIDHYPFTGGSEVISCSGGINTHYYGYGVNGNDYGLQSRIELAETNWLDSLREVMGAGVDLWYTAQLQTERVDSCSTYFHRRTTGCKSSNECEQNVS